MELRDVAGKVGDSMVDCCIDWRIDSLASSSSSSEQFLSHVTRSVVSSADQSTFYFTAFSLSMLKRMGSSMFPAHLVSSADQFCIISDSVGCMHANLYVLSAAAVHRVVCMGRHSQGLNQKFNGT